MFSRFYNSKQIFILCVSLTKYHKRFLKDMSEFSLFLSRIWCRMFLEKLKSTWCKYSNIISISSNSGRSNSHSKQVDVLDGPIIFDLCFFCSPLFLHLVLLILLTEIQVAKIKHFVLNCRRIFSIYIIPFEQFLFERILFPVFEFSAAQVSLYHVSFCILILEIKGKVQEFYVMCLFLFSFS